MKTDRNRSDKIFVYDLEHSYHKVCTMSAIASLETYDNVIYKIEKIITIYIMNFDHRIIILYNINIYNIF